MPTRSTSLLLLPLLLLLAAPAAAEPETFELADGDKVTGEVIERTEELIVIQHATLGRIEIPVASLKPPDPPDRGVFDTGFLAGWDREVNFGINGAFGNTDNFNIILGGTLKTENEFRRWIWTSRFIFKTARAVTDPPGSPQATTDNNARIRTRYDWLFGDSPWFFFVEPQYDFDQFQSWMHRFIFSLGPGYDIFQTEKFDLRVKAGLSSQHEILGAQDQRFTGVVGVEAAWRPMSILELTASNQTFPVFVNLPGDVRNLTQANVKLTLTESPKLSLNFGIENDFQSYLPRSGSLANDFKYFGTLGLGF